jgi:hypothetical protein
MYLVAFTLFYANAQPARINYHYKNSLEKLLKTNTTDWFNRMWRFNHLMPKYIHITVSRNNANSKLIITVSPTLHHICIYHFNQNL